MDQREQCIQMVNELITGIDQGDFSGTKPLPDKYTYGHLRALFALSPALDDGKELYEQLYNIVMEHGKSRIRKKVQNGEKIKIAFLAISAAEWPAEKVYRLLESDERVECCVVVSPLADRDPESRRDNYRQTFDFFRQNGYDVRGGYDEESDTCVLWPDLGGMPDIVIHLTTWWDSLPNIYKVVFFPLSCINCYIPYGIYTANSIDGSYVRYHVYNKDFVNLMWKVYADSLRNLEGYQEYGFLQGRNAACSGYAKMDYFYDSKKWEEEEIKKIWKIPSNKKAEDMKKIIIAPHHAILGYGGIKFSTFPMNAFFLLYLAEKYRDSISFILKPHPNLRFRAVEAKVFESYEAYDAYLAKWDALPNARVVQEAGYLDIFATSDGMIMDSASFIAEYMYVNKPLLFLRRNGQAFNKLGEKLLQAYHLAGGDNYTEIENFLQDIILKENDVKKDVREKIWKEELDYMRINQCTASEYIYEDIKSLWES